jgi:hypothetical protein
MRLILFFVTLLLIAVPVLAQQPYSSWSNPKASNKTLRELINELNSLVVKAEKARAADVVFLRDLQNLIRNYDTPLQSTVLIDDFADGNFNINPVWTVSEGRYWVEKDWGLRSAVTAQIQSTSQQQTTKTDSKDVALAILGKILKKATRSSGATKTSAPALPQAATIHTQVNISNAFSMEFELSSWQEQGRLDIGPYKGTNIKSGYRLSYTPGGAMALIRITSKGSSIVQESTSNIPLEDKKTHTVTWTRGKNARMSVTIDAKPILNFTDREFSDPFQGITISNSGGDYIIKRIAISNLN